MRIARITGVVLVVLASLAAVASAAPIIIDKAPNGTVYQCDESGCSFVPDFWAPLDGFPNGFYVFANSFEFNQSGAATGVYTGLLGAYMANTGCPDPQNQLCFSQSDPGTPFQFILYGDASGQPDPTDVLGFTAFMTVASTTQGLVTAPLINPVSLVLGDDYWIAASTVGSLADGAYIFGAHTPLSGSSDNAGDALFISDDPAGQTFFSASDNFEDPNELAVHAEFNPVAAATVPEPASFTLLGTGILAVAFRLRRRRAS